jgi:hypothetical protein
VCHNNCREQHKKLQLETVKNEQNCTKNATYYEKIRNEYIKSLRIIQKLKVNIMNKITETGALAVPVLGYSFGIITWR